MSIVRSLSFVLVFLLLSLDSWGQAARSPFSSLMSIGEPIGNAFTNTQGMGGVGVSQPQPWYLNNQNPALLIYNTLTVFQGGMLGETRTVRGDTSNEQSTGGNMLYLATAFPVVVTKWTSSLGLMPYTSLNYKIRYLDVVSPTNEPIAISETGEGGLTQFYWSNGVRLYKNLAVGVKASYIFSSVLNTYTNRLIETSQPVNSPVTIDEKVYVKDFAFSAGVSYSIDSLGSQGRHRLSIGAVYNFDATLNAEQRYRFFRSSSVGDVFDPDTLFSSSTSIFIPKSFTAGISFSRDNKWSLGTEFTYQDWTTFRNANGSNENLGKAWRGGFGGDLIPDILSENFFRRMQYRAGVSMEQYPFSVTRDGVTSSPVKDFGINFGFSMPAGRSSIDLAFKYGKRGNRSEHILEETYFRVYLGVTFNDQWFVKRRFD